MTGRNERFERYTLRRGRFGGVDVLGWGTYPRSSVLAGQPMKVFLDTFDTVEQAQATYPQATQFSSRWTDPQVSIPPARGERPCGRRDVSRRHLKGLA